MLDSPHVSSVSVETEPRGQLGSGDNTTPASEGDVTEKEATVSSTTAGETILTSV